MCIVDLLELVRCLGIVGVLVGVELQRQLPVQEKSQWRTFRRDIKDENDASPVRSLNVIRRGNLLNSQHVVERLARGGQRALPLLLCHDSSRHKLRKETRHVSEKDLAMGWATPRFTLLQKKKNWAFEKWLNPGPSCYI